MSRFSPSAGYTFVAQTYQPYLSCWDWNTFSGSQFAARAAAWSPTIPGPQNEQSLRCLPEVFPTEWQMFNLPPPCPEQQCSGCKSGQKCSGNVVRSVGNCPSCKQQYLSQLNGYAINSTIDTHNPLLTGYRFT